MFYFEGMGERERCCAGGCCGQFNLWFAAEMFRIFNMTTKPEDICAN